MAIRAAWWLLIQPVPVDDFEVYAWSAAHLLQSLEYRVPSEGLLLIAYRPPGTAFLVAMAMLLTGSAAWAPLLLNSVCCIGTGWLVWKTIRPKLTEAAALAAVALLVFWPSEVMFASLPQSESPSILGVALLMFLVTRRQGRLMAWAVSTGLITGLICLIRNSNLVLVPVWMLAAIRMPDPVWRRIRVCAVITMATFLPILPWTYRNFSQLGVPVLVATNGGENLHRANNDTTGGSWDAASVAQVHIYLPDEVKMDRVSSQLAKEWILAHPVGFAKLAVNKLRILLSSDAAGPYWTLVRGAGYTGPWLLAASLWPTPGG